MKKIILLLASIFPSQLLLAQDLDVLLQLRPRLEVRNGYKTLLTKNQSLAAFISQRSRLTFDYEAAPLQLKFSLQNIGVWGDVPPMRLSEKNSFAVFEAYGDYFLKPNLKFRVGRQVLSYDNQRIFGEVNWAQQGQSHDAALISWLPSEGHQLDIGVAYQAETESLSELPYRINSYQNLQFAWYHLDLQKSALSFLLLNTGYEFDVAFGGRRINFIQTYGSYYEFSRGALTGDLAFYGQSGKRELSEINAYYGGANFTFALSETLKIGVGAEYFSGKNGNSSSSEITSFTPLFGTNHGFNGYMDYFFVRNHLNSVGLVDLNGKITYSSGKKIFSIMPHFFSSAAEVYNQNQEEMNNYLGTEIDFAGSYKLHKDVVLSLGYSQMFATEALEVLKGGDSDRLQNLAWLMISFHPSIFSAEID